MAVNEDLRIQRGYLQIKDQSFPIYEGVNIIGRDFKATVSLKDVILSKLHAIISVVDANTHLISDLRSANATKLGNVKLNPYQYYNIDDKDVITFGNLIAVYFKNAKCPVNQNSTESHGWDYGALTQIMNEPATQLNNLHDADTEILDLNFKKPTSPGKVFEITSIDIHDQPTQLNSSNFHEMVTQVVKNPFKSNDTNFNNDLTQIVPLQCVLKNSLAAAGDNLQNETIAEGNKTQSPSRLINATCEMITQPIDINFSKDRKCDITETATQNVDMLSPIHCYDDIFANESFRLSLERSISKYDMVVDETVMDNKSFKENDIPDQVPPATQPIGFKRKTVKPLSPSDDSQDTDKQTPPVTQPIGFKRKNSVPLPLSDDSDDIVMGTQNLNSIETDIARSELNSAKSDVIVDTDSETDVEDSAEISKRIQEMNKDKEKMDSGSDTDVDEYLTSECSTKAKKKKLHKKRKVDKLEDNEKSVNNTRESDSTDVEDNLLTDVSVKKDDDCSDAETQVAKLNLVRTHAQEDPQKSDGNSDVETDVEELNLSAQEEEKAEGSATDVEDNLIEDNPACVEKEVNVEDSKRNETPEINNILDNDSDTDVEEELLQVNNSLEDTKNENVGTCLELRNKDSKSNQNNSGNHLEALLDNKIDLPSIQVLKESSCKDHNLFLQPTQLLESTKSIAPSVPDAETNELPPTQLLTDSFIERDCKTASSQVLQESLPKDHKKSNIAEADPFLQPTQKLEQVKSIKPIVNEAEINELPPTQLLTDSFVQRDSKSISKQVLKESSLENNKILNIDEDDIFLQSTQILEPMKKMAEAAETKSLKGSENKYNTNDEDDLFLQPTQLLHIPMDVEEKQDVFLQTTQKLPESNDEDVYNFATQKFPDAKQEHDEYSIATQKLNLESPKQIFMDSLNDSQQGSLRLYMSEDSLNDGQDDLKSKQVDTPAVDVETQLEVNFDLDTQKFYTEEQTRRPNNPLGQMFSDEETQETQNEDTKENKLKADLLSDIEHGLKLVPVVARMDITKSKITLKDIQDASTSKLKKAAMKVQKPKVEPTRKSKRNVASTSSKFEMTPESIENMDDDDDDEIETVTYAKPIASPKAVLSRKCESSSDNVGRQKLCVKVGCADSTTKSKDEVCEEFVRPGKPHNTRGKRLNYKSLVDMEEKEQPAKEELKIYKKVEPRARINKRKNSVSVQSKTENDSSDEDLKKAEEAENEVAKPRARVSRRKSCASVQKTENNDDSDDDFKILRHTPRKRTHYNRKEDKERTQNGVLSISDESSESSISSIDRKKRTKVLRICSSEESEIVTASTCTEGSTGTPRNMRTPKRSCRSVTSSEESLTTLASTSASILGTPIKKRRHYEPLNVTVTQESTNVRISFKHKVVFTMLSDDGFKTSIKKLGGSVIETVNSCTVLVTNKISRSLKFLLAIALGKPIVDVTWIDDSIKEGRFLDPWDYLLNDSEMEKKLDMNLKQSLKRSCQRKLLSGEIILLAVNKNFDVLKDIIETSGAKCVNRISTKVPKMIVVAYEEERSKYSRFLKQKTLTVVSAEAIFCGVLKQELNWKKYLLS